MLENFVTFRVQTQKVMMMLCVVGKLVLKIPWKNLYTEAVIAEIDGVYALAVPNAG